MWIIDTFLRYHQQHHQINSISMTKHWGFTKIYLEYFNIAYEWIQYLHENNTVCCFCRFYLAIRAWKASQELRCFVKTTTSSENVGMKVAPSASPPRWAAMSYHYATNTSFCRAAGSGMRETSDQDYWWPDIYCTCILGFCILIHLTCFLGRYWLIPK